MEIVVVGMNHKTTEVALLERLAIGAESLPKALRHLLDQPHVSEGVVLSTCNRIEAYASVSRFHGGVQDIRNFLAEFCHVPPEDFNDRLYTYHDEAAVRHLFRVASGIDSMVVGESEILGQVRAAFSCAEREGAVQRVLRGAFRRALHVGKRARTETEIGRNPSSVSAAAVQLARRSLDGSLVGKRIAIVGAGKMGRLTGRALAGAGAAEVVVVNRSEDNGRALADALGGRTAPLAALPAVLRAVDIAICSTTAPRTVIDRSLVESAATERGGRPLLLVDIAVPRDVDPTVGDLPGVMLHDIEDLKSVVAGGVGSRMAEVSKVEEIVGAEVEGFMRSQRSTEYGPAIRSLLDRAERLRAAEVERHVARHPATDKDALDRTTKRLVAKLLHDPLERMKELDGDAGAHLAALRELFELDDAGG